MRRLLLTTAIAALGALALAGGALAQNAIPNSDAVRKAAPLAQGSEAGKKDDRSGLESQIGGLPFTGIDMIVLGGIALVLTGTGFGLHRLSEPRV
jgi:hypothetical protein